ncbi:MAG: ABC transporter substrate-binding protein, partial [Campylobacterota bacterium]|nr:ABC transporter substrate-binding protein [Campylobacterota bacterium]
MVWLTPRFFFDRAKRKPVKIIASIFQHSPLVFISKKDSGIYSPYEMKGKRLSFQKGLDDVLLLGILKGAKLTENDYNY